MIGKLSGPREAGTIPVAPAIANAIYDAVGFRLTQLPMTPERLMLALKEQSNPLTTTLSPEGRGLSFVLKGISPKG